jgi:hypothetical protein
MNERIKQLAEQAGWGKGETHDDCMQCSPFDKEKFAELIVRECAEHLESSVLVPNSEHSRVKWKCIRAIKEHFGVEE